nr:HDOD domain-containing protein [Desulfovibrio inopinatus]
MHNRVVSWATLPIVDEKGMVWGSEFLYRNSPDAYVAFIEDADQATLDVLSHAAMNLGGGSFEGLALVNFTPWTITEDFCLCLSPRRVVIGLTALDDMDGMLRAIDVAKRQGYNVSLSVDSVKQFSASIAQRVDMVEFDVSTMSSNEAQRLVAMAQRHHVSILGKYISNRALFKAAKSLGCTLFQGFFFSEPVRYAKPRFSSSASLRMRLLKEIELNEPDIDALTVLVEAEPSISYRLLACIHAVCFSTVSAVTSIKHAIRVAGWQSVRSWLRLMVVTDVSPPDTLRNLAYQAAVRAKTLELAALESGQRDLANTLFLLGLFSLLDTQLDDSMDSLVGSLPVDTPLADALRGHDNGLFHWLGLVVMDEQGDFERVDQASAALGLPANLVSLCRIKSVAWAQGVFNLSR